MVWQEGFIIRYCRLSQDNPGFYFEPVVTIDDEGENQNPDIQNTDYYTMEQFIAWEKAGLDFPTIWYSYWSYGIDQWSEPVLLYGNEDHFNIRFSKSMDQYSGVPFLLSDYHDSTGFLHISGYDFEFQGEFISEFTQPDVFQSDLFTNDIITKDYWQTGYLSFRYAEAGNNYDIFSSDNGFLQPQLLNFCRIDSTTQPDQHPQLFQGEWHSYYFDLFCIWESWRNGHWQLFSSSSPVYLGSVPETGKEGNLKVRAYPNPFEDFLWLEYESGVTAPVRVTVFNTFGQLIKTVDKKDSKKGKMTENIDLRNVPAGIYLVRIEAGNAVTCIKVIKK
jgi:hypothetical protein